MCLTEAYIISIPEAYLIVAISILVINGLVGIKRPDNYKVQNELVAINELSVNTTKTKILNLTAKKLDKSILPLGILSLLLTIALVNNIDISANATYISRFIFDEYSKIIKLIVLLGSAVILLIGLDLINIGSKKTSIHGGRLTKVLIKNNKDARNLAPYLELVILIILAVVGLMVIVSSYDLLSLYVGIELQSLALYVLAAYKTSSEFSTEAGLKYFILGALSSGFLLFGSSILYGLTGTIQLEEIAKILILQDTSYSSNTALVGLFFVFSGLFFKSSIAPFHQWTPDVYEGSPMLITLFFASIPKLAIFSILVRILSIIPESTIHNNLLINNGSYELVTHLLIGSALLSILIGSFTGLYQHKLKRLFAYSTILNMGYLLIGLVTFSIEGLQALFFYLFIYLITNIGLFTIFLAVKLSRSNNFRDIELHPLIYITELKTLRNQPLLAFSFVIIVCSLAGLPPFAGFFAKLSIFFSAISLEYYLLSILAVLLSVVSCFYYLRLLKALYFSSNSNLTLLNTPVFIMPISFLHSLILSLVVLSLILFILYPGPLLSLSFSLALHILS